MSFAGLLNRTVYIQRPSAPGVTVDDWNQPAQTYAATSIGPIRARIREIRGIEKRQPNQQGAQIIDAEIDFLPDEDVRASDRIYDPTLDRTYEVHYVAPKYTAHRLHHLIVDARLVQATVGLNG